MKASFFEPIRYIPPQKMPAQWPLPPGLYDREVGVQTFQSTVERLQFVEELGFDWLVFPSTTTGLESSPHRPS